MEDAATEAAPLLAMKGAKFVIRRLRFRCGCCARCRLQFVFRTTHQTRTRRYAMGKRWQADMVRRQIAGDVGDGTLYGRYPAFYLAYFDLCPAKRARGRTGDSSLLAGSHSRPHIRFEDGRKGKLGLQGRGRTWFRRMTVRGHSLQGRPSGKSSHVRCDAESVGQFRMLAATLRAVAG
jgi:hypothetical protein